MTRCLVRFQACPQKTDTNTVSVFYNLPGFPFAKVVFSLYTCSVYYHPAMSEFLPEENPTTLTKTTVGAVGLFFLELIKIAVLAGITIWLVRHFLFKPFYVKGQSMEPTFLAKEYLIIDELSYRFREPKRGDVIVFHEPLGTHKDFYLKRVIGLPGERVHLQDSTIIIYNEEYPTGLVLDEPYINEITEGSENIQLGEQQYFVLGDNRDASFDSRRFGPIDRDLIVGRAWVRGWPFARFEVFSPPLYIPHESQT